MKYRLIVFDLDGTILDTLDDLTESTNYALEKNGFPKRTKQEVRRFVGNGIAKLIERALPVECDEKIRKKVLQDFCCFYEKHCADLTKPYDNILNVIKELKESGYLTAVVSNKADFAVQELCNQYFGGLFDFVVGERQGIGRKPSPDTVFEVLSKLAVSSKEAVYIGDSEVDIQTAKNAGIDIISVTWGFRDREELLQHGAVCFVETPGEIIDII